MRERRAEPAGIQIRGTRKVPLVPGLLRRFYHRIEPYPAPGHFRTAANNSPALVHGAQVDDGSKQVAGHHHRLPPVHAVQRRAPPRHGQQVPFAGIHAQHGCLHAILQLVVHSPGQSGPHGGSFQRGQRRLAYFLHHPLEFQIQRSHYKNAGSSLLLVAAVQVTQLTGNDQDGIGAGTRFPFSRHRHRFAGRLP